MGAWLNIQNEKITCNYCGASEPFYLHLIAEFSGQHYKCAAQQSVQADGAYCSCQHIERPLVDKAGICFSCHQPRR